MVQIDAIKIIVELLREVTAVIGHAIRTNDDDKRWLIVKRERQFLQLAASCLQVMESYFRNSLFMIIFDCMKYNVVGKLQSVGPLFSPNEIKSIIEVLLQLYTTVSQHSLFPLLSNDHMASALSSSGCSNSGHFPVLIKVSHIVVDILRLFAHSGQMWSNYVFSSVLINAVELPRYFKSMIVQP